jgi:hypothetical protein
MFLWRSEYRKKYFEEANISWLKKT